MPDETRDDCDVGPSAANRGGRKTVESATAQPPRRTLVTYRSKGRALETCSVSLATVVRPQEQDNANARPIAEILWGNGGATQEASVDFQNGTVVRLVADYVRVVGTFQEPIDSATWENFVGSAFVLPGNHAGLNPTFSSLRRTVSPASDAFVPIPNWAKSWHLHHATDFTPYDTMLDITAVGGDADAQTLSIITGDVIGSPIPSVPIPNGARALHFEVTGGPMQDMGFLVQFNLGL